MIGFFVFTTVPLSDEAPVSTPLRLRAIVLCVTNVNRVAFNS
jgi:hypothetical protein